RMTVNLPLALLSAAVPLVCLLAASACLSISRKTQTMMRNPSRNSSKQLVPLPPNNSMQLLPLLNLLCRTMMTCFHPSTSRSRERRLRPLHQHRNKQLLPLRLRNHVLPLNKQLVPLPPNNSMQLLPLLNLLCPTMLTSFHPSTS